MDNFLIDSHCHLYEEYYEDLDDILNKSRNMGIKYFIVDGVDTKTNKEVLNLANNNSDIYVTLGIHPEEVDNVSADDYNFIINNLKNSKVIAIGEIGLDYHLEVVNKEKQKEAFERQLIIAEQNNLPVVIHCRDAYFDTINILKRHNVKGVIHCFSGSKEIANEFIKLGFYLGVTGVVTFKNAKLIDTIKTLGIEKFILETDSPYLTPVPNRGKINIPGYTNDIAFFIADNLKVDIDDIKRITNKNVFSVFDKIIRQ